MKFKNKDEVKKWLRDLSILNRDVKMKIEFYNALINDLLRLREADFRLSEATTKTAEYIVNPDNIVHYRSEIEREKNRYENTIKDFERLSKMLSPDETMVLTARFLKGMTWDSLEFKIYFSRRQCFRLFDRAAEKLVGQSVGEW